MLKKSTSGVLASLRGSTYRGVRLASSLAAALLEGHFEHSAWVFRSFPRRADYRNSATPKWFFLSLLDVGGKDSRLVVSRFTSHA
jgi:hypothetical protein